MPSRQQIKGRIKSVKSTKQITKAMELVSAARMRKSQELAHRSRRFAVTAQELLASLRGQVDISRFKLFTARRIKTRLLIVVTSDRGLAGSYNSNILKTYLRELLADQTARVKNRTIAIGRQAINLTARLQDATVIGAYRGLSDQPAAEQLRPIVATAIRSFLAAKVDAVDVIYTHSRSSINQEVRIQRLLPAGFDGKKKNTQTNVAKFEPSPSLVLKTATRRLIEAQLMQALLEAVASEHSMRMLAMKNATDNATELIEDYTLAYNNARQAAITQELAEIVGGAEAMNG